MDFLNSKERKHFFETLKQEYGYTGSTKYVLHRGGRDKLYIIHRDIEKIPYEELNIIQSGLYIANEQQGIRLTLDGSIFFGNECKKKHAVSIEERDVWMRGENIPYTGDEEGYILVIWEKNVLGCGKIRGKEIINFVGKGRRIQDPH